jgi:excisionase family DNA binding protein
MTNAPQRQKKQISGDELLTSHEVGELLQVVPGSIVKWVNAGLLRAFRTPGGHRRIRTSDLVVFLRSHNMYIPEPLQNVALETPTRVLLVDDDRPVLTALQRGMRGYRDQIALTTVDNGVEALLRVGAAEVDVLIIDVHMPDMDGVQVLSHLVKLQSPVKVIIMTGKPSSELSKRCRNIGAVDVIEKPLNASRLAEAVNRLGQRPRKSK